MSKTTKVLIRVCLKCNTPFVLIMCFEQHVLHQIGMFNLTKLLIKWIQVAVSAVFEMYYIIVAKI